MARMRSIKRPMRRIQKKNFMLSFLPESVQAFLARRLVDIFAFILSIAGFFILIALSSYYHMDPSWNTASVDGGVVLNWAGSHGAWVADLFLQTLGIGGFILSFGLLIWGFRCFKRHILTPFWLRLISLLVASVCLSIAFAQIPSGGWTVHPYLGSSAGTLLLERLNVFSPVLGTVGVPVISGIFAFLAFLYAVAITQKEITFVFNKVKILIFSVFVFGYSLYRAFSDWLAHYNDPDYKVAPLDLFKKIREAAGIQALQALQKTSSAKDSSVSPVSVEKTVQSSSVLSVKAPEKQAEAIPVVKSVYGNKAAQSKSSAQQKFNLYEGEWSLPSLDLLQCVPNDLPQNHASEVALRKNAELLQNVLADFNIEGEITSIHPGPVVTLYELEPAPGTKSSRVISLSDDIARSMSVVSVRIAVVPGRNVIGVELPNQNRQTVYMHDLLSSRLFEKTRAKLPIILGKDIVGQPILADLSKMPHLLVAGTTGSGKSVAVNTMILSLLFRLPPEKCRFIMIDPKMLELSAYDDIPHLLSPVVTEPGKAIVALKWAVQEMEERYRSMSKLGVRNIEGYNNRLKEARDNDETIIRKVQTGFDTKTGVPVFEDQAIDLTELPYIVVVVDEFADLMLVAGKDVENAIQRLAQMARAAGIHLIMATQRPSVDVITGVIKANFPTRISFSVTSKIDSRTILGEGGAEQLLGMGDMLYMAPGGRVTRVHGPFVSDRDVEKIASFLRSQGKPSYLDNITDGSGDFGDNEVMNAMFGGQSSDSSNSVDELYDRAVALVAREGKASTSFVQRHLQIGYNRAARIVEEMEKQGIISSATSTGKREVLIRDFSDV